VNYLGSVHYEYFTLGSGGMSIDEVLLSIEADLVVEIDQLDVP
jgi:hypothetical protein